MNLSSPTIAPAPSRVMEPPMAGHGFADLIDRWDWDATRRMIMASGPSDVRRVLAKAERASEPLSPEEFGILISPAAAPFIEDMARLSRRFTLERFGKTISLYIPMYVSNACANACVYCGFNHANPFERTVLSQERIVEECEAIRRLGDFDNLLIVSGEFPSLCGLDYFRMAVTTALRYFNNISLEVQPLRTHEYKALADAGLYGVVCFQETYNRANYRKYHPKGMKSLFDWRLNGFDRMGQAGIHKIGMGVLLGLEDWRTDITMLARHLRYLQKRYWQTRYSVNFPRLCSSESGYQPRHPVSDRELVQLTLAFRIFDHDVDISYSTRESPSLRDNMMCLGVTSMSAGSRTEPGGYALAEQALKQFDVTDDRTPASVVASIRERGYYPVWKDWEICLGSTHC